MDRTLTDRIIPDGETLLPKLQKAVQSDGLIHHPLMIMQMFSVDDPVEVARANSMFLHKSKAARRYLAEANYLSYLTLVERPYRVGAFYKLMPLFTDQQYWEWLGEIWIDAAFPFERLRKWKALFGSDRSNRHLLMDEAERAALANMPDVLTIYRGGKNRDGLGWTLSEDVAKKFAFTFVGARPCNRVFEGTVPKSKVYAFLTGRNEQTIIVDPRFVTVQTNNLALVS